MEKFKLQIGGRELKIEIKNLAEMAAGSCLVQYGDTLVLSTVVISEREREGIDFFPLTVDYEERYYAAGKILGSRYIRRESRPSDEAILTSRLIDRTIRPLFPKDLKREVQIVVTCLSWDRENDPDIIGLVAASLVLSFSKVPWSGPISAVRVGKIGDEFILNPTYEQRESSCLDLVVVGVEKSGEILINMMEAEASEISEEVISKATEWAMPYLKKLIDFQNQIIKKVYLPEKILIEAPRQDLELEKEIEEFLGVRLEKALYQPKKAERVEDINNLKEELISYIEEGHPQMGKGKYARDFFEKEIERLVHENIINPPAGGERRPDGRKLDEIREISCEAGILPRTHGSGLFCRGQTKSLSILTLGAPRDVKLLEGMEIVGKKRFMHHYNFPPYSTGEIKPMRGPGRRDIGHGMLAEKALLPLIPSFEEFPYTIRIVSEILSSNGSTSMASVSSSSLALMDAGVPIKKPATGIALGLMQNAKGDYKILTDIQGPEDHYGDMDLKVAGTKDGICAIQMDVKITGISQKILKEVLEQGKRARLQILDKMAKVIEKPRPELSPFAPRILTIQISPEKIREVIGPGGRVINEIIEECGVSIDVEDNGKIFVTAEKEEAAKKAIAWIKNITREVKVGEIFQGKVKRILDFGAFVEILPGQEGLVHISQLAPYRVKRVEDIVKLGEILPVKVISIDEQGRINLSLKEAKK
ncbi:MAG: polyribonucleotide nucleotidyltransferase [Parcubacteria group bacterium CG2_30_36_18]|uniref:Polyribonucleotide nucleotidyltransferase n=2 Tax=Candidatus Nealsoniibacteriota TaxID=1817911 RepID=A0A2M8DM13_9BACT|nr:MAG: polyribonucleotide nucleotidyltransferase [Parcubacteria group bacterium CG2_30_36_18]PIX88618.1 MAG: polyribonucleotide nucleotidyltransferase [Candidatus Nealsonbacteria bacterium CG_4_10_14_3_um_filter_36_16]PJB98993.1 MAG: polyribonucleotide nucleotidyltransferase [Candidatus Nealsonbacteria bacterium CG_4_9_14_0_8_um_filter_36_17]